MKPPAAAAASTAGLCREGGVGGGFLSGEGEGGLTEQNWRKMGLLECLRDPFWDHECF